MSEDNRKKPPNRSSIQIFTTIIIGVCLMGCPGILAFNAVSPTTGMTGHVCIGLTTTPKWQIGLSWALPISSYAPSLSISPYAVCTDIPESWLTGFTSKMAGELMFPP